MKSTDNEAANLGYTKQFFVSHGTENVHVSVRPGSDLDSDSVRAFDHDGQEFIWVVGWACDWEEVTE